MREEILLDINNVTLATALEWYAKGYSVEKLSSRTILLTRGGAW